MCRDHLDLETTVDALAALVHAEYPDGYTLAQIAERWGLEYGITPGQVEAIRRVEQRLPEPLDGLIDQATKRLNIQATERFDRRIGDR